MKTIHHARFKIEAELGGTLAKVESWDFALAEDGKSVCCFAYLKNDETVVASFDWTGTPGDFNTHECEAAFLAEPETIH